MQNKLYIKNPILRRELIDFLSGFILERRLSQIQNVIKERTKYIAVVLEDIYQSQNASAVLRTCECLGIQDVHYIEGIHCFHINPQVVQGSSKWLTIRNYNGYKNNSIKAVESLKADGYRIVATSPHVNENSIDHFDLDKGKIAIFFGTEKSGLSQAVMNNADEYISIPMLGFTESYNISVSVAIVVYTLIKKLRDSEIDHKLSLDESETLLLTWLRATLKNCRMIEKRFFQEKNIECIEKY